MAKHDHAPGGQLIEDSEADNPSAEEQADADEHATSDRAATRSLKLPSHVGLALTVGAAAIVGVAGLGAWEGYRTYGARQAQTQRSQLVESARQGALNLTTIDHTRVDADVKRILDSATGSFYDDFEKRSGPFIDVVKKVQSKSVGTITGAGLESQDGDHGQVLVAISVKTSTADAPDQDPRNWRMRISVQKVGDSMKVSDVQFVP